MTYYSRRQLEALGEPLGDSVTRKEGGRIVYGGGGSGGGGGGTPPPQQNTSYNTNIPEYAKPYVTTMLEATQKQLFNMDGSDITGFRGYKPYSTDVNNYFAGFSPLQQQAQTSVKGLQTPGQFGDATTLAGAAGLGSLGASQQYARNVTDPSMMQSYMSPYQQNVTDIAKMNAVREAQIAQNTQNLGAARQGTYGGARQTLMQAEREKNLLSNLSNIQAQGSQSAFDRAMQAQQFGSTLGIQGYGQAGQAASTLGQLGGAQLGAQRDIIGLQNQMGGQQQALEQAKINQAIQDYSTQQQYPLMQLGMMSNMLRGLPMQATTTQTYQAAPAPITQGLGLLAGAAGARQAGLFAEGGTIKSLASGGVAGYANRGMVQANPDSSVVRGIRQKLMMMDADELNRVAQSSPSEEIRAMAIQILQEQKIREQAEAQAQQSIAQDQRGLPTPVTERVGLPAAPAGAMDTLNAASGGIVAFAGKDESLVEAPNMSSEEYAKYISDVMGSDISIQRKREIAPGLGQALNQLLRKENPGAFNTSQSKGLGATKEVASVNTPNMFSIDPEEEKRLRQQYIDIYKSQREDAGVGAPKAGLADILALEKAGLAKEREQARGYDLMRFGARLASQAGPTLSAVAKAGEATLPGIIESEKELKGREREINKGMAEIKEGERLMKVGDITAGNAMFEKGQERISKERVAGMKSPGEMLAYANNYLASRRAAGDTRDENIIREEGMNALLGLRGAAVKRADTAAEVAAGNIGNKIVEAHAEIDKRYLLKIELAKKEDKPRIEAEQKAEKEKAEKIIKGGGTYEAPKLGNVVENTKSTKSASSKANPADFDTK